MVDWLKETRSLDFQEAAEEIAGWVGMSLTRSEKSEREYRERRGREDLLEDAFDWMAGRLRRALKLLERQGEHAQADPELGSDARIILTLQRARGYSLAEIGQMPLGTYPDQVALKDQLLGSGRWKIDDWVQGKLFTALPRSTDGSGECAFGTTHRLCGVVRSASGRALTLTAWQSDGAPSPAKYGFLSNPPWPKAGCLVGLERLRGCEEVLLVEGYFDALYPGYCHGFNAVGILGASLSLEHIAGLRAAGVKRIFLGLDREPWKQDSRGVWVNAGHDATVKAIRLLASEQLPCYVVEWALELGKDLDACCRAGHADALRQAQAEAISAPAWLGREIARGLA